MTQVLTSAPSALTPSAGAMTRYAPVIVLVYLALQCLSRILIPSSLGVDEAEQMITAQSLDWGYGRQPPLYTWIQIGVFQIVGEGKVGLVLLKHALMAAIYLGVWVLARWLGAGPIAAGMAILGTALLPTVIWNAQRELTHLVLVTAMSVWTMIAVLAALERSKLWLFVLIGVMFGAGLLSKWNYTFFQAGLLGVILIDRRARTPLWLVSVAVMLAVIGLPGWWAYQNWDLTTAAVQSFEMERQVTALGALDAFWDLIECVLAEIAILAIVFFLCLLAGQKAAMEPPWQLKMIERIVVIGLVIVALGAALSGVTEIRHRWLLPLLIFVPLILAVRFEAKLTPQVFRWFTRVVLVVMLAVLILFPRHLLRGHSNPARQSTPFAAAADAIELKDGLALAPNFFIGGNVRLVRPDIAVITPQVAALRVEGPPDLVIWGSRDRAETPAPSSLAALTEMKLGYPVDLSSPETVAVPYPTPHQDRFYHMFWVEMPE
ncbi:MAG: glycosyltransferase family 39 protein [Rhodobacteraceae bacterium]|nr:glycosyltransferase family 39 protein [Paracoccaceae bacterium]